jgi:hypothetical protein
MIAKYNDSIKKPSKDNLRISIYRSIIVPKNWIFTLKENRSHKQIVEEGAVLWYIDGEPVKVHKLTYIVLPSSHLYPGEEYCFLGEVI